MTSDTEPLHEWKCPECGATTRARMADQEGGSTPPVAWAITDADGYRTLLDYPPVGGGGCTVTPLVPAAALAAAEAEVQRLSRGAVWQHVAELTRQRDALRARAEAAEAAIARALTLCDAGVSPPWSDDDWINVGAIRAALAAPDVPEDGEPMSAAVWITVGVLLYAAGAVATAAAALRSDLLVGESLEDQSFLAGGVGLLWPVLVPTLGLFIGVPSLIGRLARRLS